MKNKSLRSHSNKSPKSKSDLMPQLQKENKKLLKIKISLVVAMALKVRPPRVKMMDFSLLTDKPCMMKLKNLSSKPVKVYHNSRNSICFY